MPHFSIMRSIAYSVAEASLMEPEVLQQID